MLEKNTYENARRHRIRAARPQLPGRAAPRARPQRQLRPRWRRQGLDRPHLPVRRPVLGDPRLGQAQQRRLLVGDLPGHPRWTSTSAKSSNTWCRTPAPRASSCYVEGIKDARRFVSALRAAARVKPVLLIKVGRHPVGSRAAQLHSGAMVGEDTVFDAALRRAGVIRLYNLGQLFAAANALFSHFRPRGNHLADHHQRRRAGRDGRRPRRRPAHPAGQAVATPRSPSSTSSCRPTGPTATPSTSSATPTPSATARPSRSCWPTRTSKACSPCCALRP